jgi:hypothetical protein
MPSFAGQNIIHVPGRRTMFFPCGQPAELSVAHVEGHLEWLKFQAKNIDSL